MIKQWISIPRQLVPVKVKNLVKGSRLYIRLKSAYINMYHCCVHKTASQWIRAILSDPRTYRYSDLSTYTYQNRLPGRSDHRKITDRAFVEPFPRNTIVTPLYIDFENFAAIPKSERYKAFFIMRDTRDLVISWYFSIRYSHTLTGRVPEISELLSSMSLTDGLLYTIERLHDQGQYSRTIKSGQELYAQSSSGVF